MKAYSEIIFISSRIYCGNYFKYIYEINQTISLYTADGKIKIGNYPSTLDALKAAKNWMRS